MALSAVSALILSRTLGRSLECRAGIPSNFRGIAAGARVDSTALRAGAFVVGIEPSILAAVHPIRKRCRSPRTLCKGKAGPGAAEGPQIRVRKVDSSADRPQAVNT